MSRALRASSTEFAKFPKALSEPAAWVSIGLAAMSVAETASIAVAPSKARSVAY